MTFGSQSSQLGWSLGDRTKSPDHVIEYVRHLLNTLPLRLHNRALAFMEHGNERDAANALGITRHALRTGLDNIRRI